MGILKKIFSSDRTLLLTLVALIIFSYRKIFNGFFQQDEWFSYALYILHKNLNLVDQLKFFFAPNIGHYNPITVGVQQVIFSFWGMDYGKFSLLGITLHTLVVIALYFLAKIIFEGNKILAFASALIFALLAAHYQATAWVVANISTLSSSLLGIISATFFLQFLKSNKKNFLIYSLVLVTVSLFIKEITIGLLPLFFLLCFIERKGDKHKLSLFLIGGFGLAYFLFRIGMIFLPISTTQGLVTGSQPIWKIAYNFLTLPFKSLSQAIFPIEVLKSVASYIAPFFPDKLSGDIGTSQFENFVIKRVMESLSILISFLILLAGWYVYKNRKSKKEKLTVVLALAWPIINSFIFSFAPEQPNIIFAVDSRNLYFSSIGLVLFIVFILNNYFVKNKKGFWVLLALFVVLNYFWLQRDLGQFIERGKIRKYILTEILNSYPTLPQKTIFYTESDSAYYGLPDTEKILPFQSGLGQTLLASYYEAEKFPEEFYENRFLWEITDQGYKEVGGRGFGYFRDMDLLNKILNEYNLPKDSIIAYKWNSITEILIDITEKTKSRL